MPRVIKPDEYLQKRGEILDVAQRLIYTKGYELMSIQDILDALGISKGAFYHYFASKQDLLEAMIERMMHEMEKFLDPIVQDAGLTALEKLERFFGSVASWKSARKAMLTQLLRVWYTDNNAIVRQKVVVAGGQWMAPYLLQIFRQGIQEGVMDPSLGQNEEATRVVISLMMSMGEGIALAILALKPDASETERQACLTHIENLVLAYRGAIERIMAVPPGSISLFNLDILQDWVLEPDVPSPDSQPQPV